MAMFRREFLVRTVAGLASLLGLAAVSKANGETIACWAKGGRNFNGTDNCVLLPVALRAKDICRLNGALSKCEWVHVALFRSKGGYTLYLNGKVE
jgi:hypothetical protein